MNPIRCLLVIAGGFFFTAMLDAIAKSQQAAELFGFAGAWVLCVALAAKEWS